MPQSDVEALERRVRRLETANARLRIASVLCVTLIGAGILTGMTQDQYASSIKTGELLIHDEAGETVAVLGSSGLVLTGSAGTLALLRGEATPRLTLTSQAGGELTLGFTGGGPELELVDAQTNATATLSADRLIAQRGDQKRFDLRIQEDHTQLQVLGAASDSGTQPPGLWMESTGDGGQIGIHDRNFIRAVLGELVLADDSGQQTTLPSSTLSLYDGEGNLLERIPRR
jgi:hypothetical protein